MPQPLTWRKSSFTDPNECVELAWPADGAAVRDSKNPAGPTLLFPRTPLTGLITTVKAGDFDLRV